MSSDIYTFDISHHTHSTPNIFSYDPYYPFNFIDAVHEDLNNPLDHFSSSSSSFFSINNHMLPLITNGLNTNSELEVESAPKLKQMSYSNIKKFHDKPDFPLQDYHNNTLMNSSNFQWHEFNSSENSFFTGQITRASSAGDSQDMNENTTHASQTEETKLKAWRYSAEVRKEKISKYRAKRKQRKFNKIIKYACRKTLADNRTRIRGRFARNDETNEIPKTEEYHEEEFWVDIIDGLSDELLY